MSKPFFEVFPTLKVKDDIQMMFQGVEVTKVSTNSTRDFIRVSIYSRHLIQKKDKQRASYYNYYSSKRWGDSNSYHLTLDAGKLGIDGCVDMILKFREIMDAQK